MSLHEHHVSGVLLGGRAPEVIETHFIQGRRGGVAREVAAILGRGAIGLQHHRQRVPADVGLDTPLERAVTRILRLAPGGDAVDVGGVGLERQVGAAATRVVDQPLEQEVRALRAVNLEHRIDRFEPFPRLDGIEVFQLRRFGHAISRGCRRARVVPARDRMSNDGERRQVKQVSARAPGARGGALLPGAPAPAIVSARTRDVGELDALLAIVPLPATAAAFRHLPESARWRELDARAPARAATVRTTVLSNHRQTLAVLGYLKDDASAFERLSLAGRMLKEAAARNPQTVGLAASGTAAAARAALEALLAAALVHAFALPSFRAPARHERHLRRI